MNIVTHGLASLALLRAAWPRAPKQMWIAAVVAGTIADVDLLSAWTEPAKYLAWRGFCSAKLRNPITRGEI